MHWLFIAQLLSGGAAMVPLTEAQCQQQIEDLANGARVFVFYSDQSSQEVSMATCVPVMDPCECADNPGEEIEATQ